MSDAREADIPESNVDRRSALQMLAALGGLFVALPGQTAPPDSPTQLWTDIDQVLNKTQAIWNSQDFSRLKEVWDADDPEPWYVPEEIETAFHSWPEIEKYWGPGRRVLRAFRWQFSDLKVKSLAPDLALALFDHFYEIELAVGPPSPPTAGFDRCLAIFRRKADGWKHILYAQCPLGPDTYVRALRQRIVQPDFKAFSEQVDAKFRERGASKPGDRGRP